MREGEEMSNIDNYLGLKEAQPYIEINSDPESSFDERLFINLKLPEKYSPEIERIFKKYFTNAAYEAYEKLWEVFQELCSKEIERLRRAAKAEVKGILEEDEI
jgi:hypothetical protein